MPGESIPCQPNHAFISWIALDQPIYEIGSCLLSGTRDGRGGTRPPVLTGLVFGAADGHSKILGWYTTVGPSVVLEETNVITEVSVGFDLTHGSQIPKEVIFNFKTATKRVLGAQSSQETTKTSIPNHYS